MLLESLLCWVDASRAEKRLRPHLSAKQIRLQLKPGFALVPILHTLHTQKHAHVYLLSLSLLLLFFPSLNATNPEADTKKLVSIYNDLFEAAFSVSLQCSGYNQLEVKLFKIGVLGKKKLSYFPRPFFL